MKITIYGWSTSQRTTRVTYLERGAALVLLTWAD
jgi:hypothetical protein